MRKTILLAVGIASLLLPGCASGSESGAGEHVAATTASTPVSEQADPAPTHTPAGRATIVESGFGQDGEYTHVTALVSNTGLVNEYATVVFNVYDGAGALRATEEQVEAFTAADGATAIGTQVETDFAVARVEATLSVTDYGDYAEPVEQLPAVEGIATSDGSWTFELQNATAEDWVDLRVGIICRSAGGAIAGGGSEFPSLVPAGGRYLIEPVGMHEAGATSCTAYPRLQIPMS